MAIELFGGIRNLVTLSLRDLIRAAFLVAWEINITEEMCLNNVDILS